MASPFQPVSSSSNEEPDVSAEPSTGASPVNLILVVVLVAIVAVFGWKLVGPKPALAGWQTDWDAAARQSQSTGKPAVVLFTADWCPPCRELKKETLADARVQAALQANFTPVVVDLTDRAGPNNQLAADYRVQGIPTVILFDRAGREVKRTHGMAAGDFVRWLGR